MGASLRAVRVTIPVTTLRTRPSLPGRKEPTPSWNQTEAHPYSGTVAFVTQTAWGSELLGCCAVVFGELQLALPFDLVRRHTCVAVIGVAGDADAGDEG
jgi:hypothetical protein